MKREFDMGCVLRSFQSINEREEQELLRLTQDPSVYNVAQLLTDRLHKALDYLCHYDHLVTHNGSVHDVMSVIEVIQSRIRDEFKKITGREYVPEVCRQLDKIERDRL